MIILFALLTFISSSGLYAIERVPYSLGEGKEGQKTSDPGTPIAPTLATPQEAVSNSISPISIPRRHGEVSPSFREQMSVYPGIGVWGIKGEQLEYAMVHSKYLICLINSEGKFERLSQQWKEILGWEIEELLNIPYLELVHPKDIKRTLEYNPASFNTGLTNRFLCKDGSYRWLEWIDLPALAPPQQGANFISFARDVTGQKELEKLNKKHLKQLRQDLAYKETLLKGIHEIQLAHTLEMFATGEDLILKNKHTLRNILRAFLTIIDESEIGFIGEVFFDKESNPFVLLQWEMTPSASDKTKELFKGTRGKFIRVDVKKTFLEPLFMEKRILFFKDMPVGELEKIEGLSLFSTIHSILGIPLMHLGKVVAIMGVMDVRELDEEKKMESLNFLTSLSGKLIDEGSLHKEAEAQRIHREETLAAVSEAKSTFVAHMSHEIRTPLTGLLGMLDLMDTSYLHERDIEYLKTAKNSGLNLLNILNDILDLSKIEAKQLRLENTTFNILETLQEIKQIYLFQAQQKGLEFKLNIASHVPKQGIGDPTRLRQILTNLLSNATKFTEKGTITVEIEGKAYPDPKDSLKKGFILKGSITDTGIGMLPETQAALFTSFVQGDPSITRKYGGTGLGLYITKQLCDLMGGKLKVKSEFQKGSTFIFKVFLSLPGEVECSIKSEVDKLPEELRCFARSEVKKKLPEEKISIADKRILIAEDNLVNQKILATLLSREGCKIKTVVNEWAGSFGRSEA